MKDIAVREKFWLQLEEKGLSTQIRVKSLLGGTARRDIEYLDTSRFKEAFYLENVRYYPIYSDPYYIKPSELIQPDGAIASVQTSKLGLISSAVRKGYIPPKSISGNSSLTLFTQQFTSR
jgi:hypothetical protein